MYVSFFQLEVQMAKTKYDMSLTDEQYALVTKIAMEGKESKRTVMHAKVLMLSDPKRNPKRSIPQIAEIVGVADTTVKNVRITFGNYGFEAALYRKERTKTRSSDELAERIVAISKERPPEGKKKWSLEMLCRESIDRGIVPYINKTTMMKIMHEHNPSYAEEFKE